MDFTKAFQAFESGLTTVRTLAEAGEAFGLPSQIANALNIASILVDAGENVKKLIDDGVIVANGGDKARIDAIITDIQEVNDRLAAKIADS